MGNRILLVVIIVVVVATAAFVFTDSRRVGGFGTEEPLQPFRISAREIAFLLHEFDVMH